MMGLFRGITIGTLARSLAVALVLTILGAIVWHVLRRWAPRAAAPSMAKSRATSFAPATARPNDPMLHGFAKLDARMGEIETLLAGWEAGGATEIGAVPTPEFPGRGSARKGKGSGPSAAASREDMIRALRQRLLAQSGAASAAIDLPAVKTQFGQFLDQFPHAACRLDTEDFKGELMSLSSSLGFFQKIHFAKVLLAARPWVEERLETARQSCGGRCES